MFLSSLCTAAAAEDMAVAGIVNPRSDSLLRAVSLNLRLRCGLSEVACIWSIPTISLQTFPMIGSTRLACQQPNCLDNEKA